MSNRLLLDTHIFIWWMEKNRRLTKDTFNLLNDPKNHIFLSVVSVWEMVIKKAQRKLRTPKDIEIDISSSGFTLLPINFFHALAIEKLPLHHKDPFDRMLIAQAKVERLTILTTDAKFKKYEYSLLSLQLI